MSDARRAILELVATELRGAGRPPLPPPYRGTEIAPDERGGRFTSVLERVGGRVHRVRSTEEARARLQALLAEAGATRLIVSDASELRALAADLPGVELLAPSAPRAELFAATAGLTTAQWGIAETGTLVLESAAEQHRLASLVVPLHVALLPVARLLGTLGDALAALQGPTAAPASRTITFVTGPSRTADIELELVVGVHGPKSLHVLLLEAP
ncbi:MAG TPA: lactate utilization protein [Planctomycetota bacterium]